MKHIRSLQLLIMDVFLFARCYGPGNTFLWRKTPSNPENLTLRIINMLVMEDKLSPQFGSICSELAEDYAVTDNAKCEGIDEHMYTMKTVDPGIL